MGNRSLFSVAPCRMLSLVLSFASKESTIPRRGGSPTGRRPAPAGAPKGFPRGKQSARFALPCAPLVVCLNSGSLTAFGGCIHWIPASLRSPLETLGPRRLAKLSHGAASPATRAAVGASDPSGSGLALWSSAFPHAMALAGASPFPPALRPFNPQPLFRTAVRTNPYLFPPIFRKEAISCQTPPAIPSSA